MIHSELTKRHVTAFLLVFILSTLLLGQVARAGVEEKLPADTILYAHWAGRSLTFDGSMFGQMVNDPNTAQLEKYLLDAIREEVPSEQKRAFLDHAWAMAGIGWQHPVTVALTDIGDVSRGEVKLVLMIDLGKDREAFADHLDAMLIAAMGPQADGEENAPKEGLPVRTIGQTPVRDMGPLTFGYLENTFFLTMGESVAEKKIS